MACDAGRVADGPGVGGQGVTAVHPHSITRPIIGMIGRRPPMPSLLILQHNACAVNVHIQRVKPQYLQHLIWPAGERWLQ